MDSRPTRALTRRVLTLLLMRGAGPVCAACTIHVQSDLYSLPRKSSLFAIVSLISARIFFAPSPPSRFQIDSPPCFFLNSLTPPLHGLRRC